MATAPSSTASPSSDHDRTSDFSSLSREWFWETDADHVVQYLSRNFEVCTGLDPARVLGRAIPDLAEALNVRPVAADERVFAQSEIAKRGPIQGLVCRAEMTGRAPFYIEFRARPFFDGEGVYLGYRGVAQDVTTGVTADGWRDSGRTHFRELIESDFVGHIVLRDFRPLAANRAMARMAGFDSVDDLLAEEQVLDMLVEPSRDLILQTFDDVRQHAPDIFSARAVIQSRTGQRRQTVCTIQGVMFNDVPAEHLTVFDISRFQEVEAQYQDLFENDCVGHIIWQDGVPVRANAATVAMFGFDTEADFFSGHHEVASRDEQGVSLLQVVERGMVDGEHSTMQRRWRGIATSGEEIWVDSRFRRTHWRGVPVIRETLLDVTAEVDYALALKASDSRYELVVDGAQTGIIEWNLKTHEGFVSRVGLNLLGLTGDTHKRLAEFAELYHPDDVGPHLEAIRSDDKRGEGPFRFRMPDGAYRHFWASWVNAGAYGGDSDVRIGSFRDVTEETLAKEALQQSEWRNTMIIENAQVGIFDWNTDPDVRSGYVSPLGQKLLGFDGDKQRRHVEIDPRIHPDEIDEYLQEIRHNPVGGSGTYRIDMGGGNYRSFSIQWINAGPVTGEVYRRIGSFRDVTNELKLEEERRQLEFVVRQSQKMEALGQMAGGIAHEISNLIQPILLLTKQLRTETDVSRREAYYDDIHLAATRTREITRSILAFARPDKGEVRSVRLDRALRKAVDFGRKIVPGSIEFTVDIPDVDGLAWISEAALSQIMLNLFKNAVDAQRGSGTISVSLGVKDIGARLAASYSLVPGRYFRIVVMDRGPGVNAEMREKIFEPFFTTKEHGDGTGLGLSIVHAMITAWNGAIVVDSESKQGAEFRIYLPDADVEHEHNPPLPTDPASASTVF